MQSAISGFRRWRLQCSRKCSSWHTFSKVLAVSWLSTREYLQTLNLDKFFQAGQLCNKPSLHAANLELELSSCLATFDSGVSSPRAGGASAEAAARVQAERHYQVALSHTDRGSLAPASILESPLNSEFHIVNIVGH